MVDVTLQNFVYGNQTVDNDMFGANALQFINVNESGVPFSRYEDAVSELGVVTLRYPGGHTENTINILELENGNLRIEVRNFLDWCQEMTIDGQRMAVTIVLPTKYDVSEKEIKSFVELVIDEYSDVVSGFEIGNEYSIGFADDSWDRSKHPEENTASDKVAALSESEYGEVADKVIRAVDQVITQSDYGEFEILVQGGDITGGGSEFKGTGNFSAANQSIITNLSDESIAAIDGVVFHYYYNRVHDENASFVDDAGENRSIEWRANDFISKIGKDLSIHVTEWNIFNGNYSQHGLPSVSIIWEQFEEMIELGVENAHIWPIQHNTSNNLAGPRSSDSHDLTFVGVAFDLLQDSLRPIESETGRVSEMRLIDAEFSGLTSEIEVNTFASSYRAVYYISSRSYEFLTIDLDVSHSDIQSAGAILTKIGVDLTDSDGFSDFADQNGENRISRRPIDQDEFDRLSSLPFFDEDDKNHLQIDEQGNYSTYLPFSENFVPLVANPKTISDYLVLNEVDAAPLISEEGIASGALSEPIAISLMPFESARLVVELVNRAEGTVYGDHLVGGYGRDVFLGRGGDDTIFGGEGNDTLKGGWGNDFIDGGSGDDSIVAGGDINQVAGGGGEDTLSFGFDFSEAVIDEDNNEIFVVHAGGVTAVSGVEIFQFRDISLSVDQLLSNGANPGAEPIELKGEMQADGQVAAFMVGSVSNEHIVGSSGSDTIFSAFGNDTVFAGGGDDSIGASNGDDVIFGGKGSDKIGGGHGDDLILGGEGGDVIGAGWGDDVVEGGKGADFVSGGSGDDLISSSSGDDTVAGTFGNDVVEGGSGNDWIGGGAGADFLFGDGGDDNLGGGYGSDWIEGGSGNDFLAGGSGDDTILGGSGEDRINSGVGDDSIIGGRGADIFVFASMSDGEIDIIEDFQVGIDSVIINTESNIPAVTPHQYFLDLDEDDTTDPALMFAYSGHHIIFLGLDQSSIEDIDMVFV